MQQRFSERRFLDKEKVQIAHKKIAGCLGCSGCCRSGGACVQKDDMAEIREKMLAADVIVLASPIYFYSMTAQMKAVIDRTYAFYQQLAGKTFYFIITCAATDAAYTETMLASLRGFTCCVPDAKEDGYVLGIGVMEAGEVRSSAATAEAYRLGRGV